MLPDGVRLIHVRHGETDWNAQGRLQGQLDIPMNERGLGQAARNGEAMKVWMEKAGFDPASFDYVASPLTRSSTTMRIVREKLGLDSNFLTDDRLKEVDFGRWSSHTYKELAAGGERGLVEQRKKNKWHFRPPGGETYGDLAERVGAWLETLTGDTVAVTHGGVLRVLHGHLAGTPWHQVPDLPAPQDKFLIFQDGRVTLV